MIRNNNMIRRLLISSILVIAVAISALAGLPTGTWKQYPVFGNFTKVIDTPRAVYYVTGGSLYSYDKDADETRFFEGGRDLSDYAISDIYYNYDDNYLLVAYDNANLDIVYPDGSKSNLPDIKDAAVNVNKKINDVSFHNGRIYVATAFGLVVYDATTQGVIESGIYSRPVKCVDVNDRHIVMVMDDAVDKKYHVFTAEHGKRLNTLDAFTMVYAEGGPVSKIESIDDQGRFYAIVKWGTVQRLDLQSASDYNTSIKATELLRGKDGLYFFSGDIPSKYYTLNADCLPEGGVALPAALNGNQLSAYDGLSSLWAGDSDGLGRYAVSGDALTVLRDKSVPAEAISSGNICNIFPSHDGKGFYTCNLAISREHPLGSIVSPNMLLAADYVSSEGIKRIPSVLPDGERLTSPTFVTDDIFDPGRIYVGTYLKGVHILKDGKKIGSITGANSPFPKFGSSNYASSLRFDDKGNLWISTATDDLNNRYPTIMVLPADKVRKDPSTWTVADWVLLDFSKYLARWESQVLPVSGTNCAIAFDDGEGRLLTYSHNGTLADQSDDTVMRWPHLTDQDGKEFSSAVMLCAVQDKKGHVWIGTTEGVVTINDPSRMLSPDFYVNRVKVPRNDGTNYADYLLESDRIGSIAVDNSNRKWLATNGSGLFLVSEDGSEILAHYTKDNSSLPSNVVTSVYCDPNSNSVFVGTFSGLYEFASTSGPARDDYSDVYAYPNPVEPDYSGWITITGLMGDSMVKIVDSAMNTVSQLTSEGGTAMWDGCNMNGERVRSGVYYVLASTSGDVSSTGAVATKILVIN